MLQQLVLEMREPTISGLGLPGSSAEGFFPVLSGCGVPAGTAKKDGIPSGVSLGAPARGPGAVAAWVCCKELRAR